MRTLVITKNHDSNSMAIFIWPFAPFVHFFQVLISLNRLRHTLVLVIWLSLFYSVISISILYCGIFYFIFSHVFIPFLFHVSKPVALVVLQPFLKQDKPSAFLEGAVGGTIWFRGWIWIEGSYHVSWLQIHPLGILTNNIETKNRDI